MNQGSSFKFTIKIENLNSSSQLLMNPCHLEIFASDNICKFD